MEIDNNKHRRDEGEEKEGGGDKSYKKVRFGDVEKEMREWTLLELFDGLSRMSPTQSGDELVDITYEIKKRLTGPTGLQIILSDQVKPFLKSGLSATIPAVRELTLAQLARTASAGAQGIALLTEVWPLIVKLLADDNLKVSTTAASTILTAASQTAGRELVFNHESVAAFKQMVASNEILRLRVLDLFVELSAHSPESMEQASSFVQPIIAQDINSKDLLQRMNVLELLERIAQTDHGIAYLRHTGALDAIKRLLTDTEDSGFSLLCGSALRLLSSIARQGREVQALVPLLDDIGNLLESQDESNAEAAITFIGVLGTTASGADVLLARRALLKSWFEHMTSATSLLRLSCLHALAELLTTNKDHAKTKEIFDVEDKGWDGSESGQVMRSLMKFLDQPFPELRYASFHVAQGLACHPWGVTALFAYPGFLEFILNRSTETTKEGKEWKYAIVGAIVHSTELDQTLLNEDTRARLVAYLSEGVHYARGEFASKVASKAG